MHQYKVRVEAVDAAATEAPIEFTFASHDDLKVILERMQQKPVVAGEEGTAFAVGLKIFSGVLLAHRSEELFRELAEHFGVFMRKLKSR